MLWHHGMSEASQHIVLSQPTYVGILTKALKVVLQTKPTVMSCMIMRDGVASHTHMCGK